MKQNKQANILFISGGILLLIGGLIIIYRRNIASYIQNIDSTNTVVQYVQNKVWDVTSQNRIKTLLDPVQEKAIEFINKAEQEGIKLRVTEAYRSPEDQNKDYAQGRTEPGKIITNAKAWESYHQYRVSIDVVPIVNGKADYDNADWDKIGQIGKSVGFKWGGDWSGFKDLPHFEMTYGYTVQQLKKMVDSGNFPEGLLVNT